MANITPCKTFEALATGRHKGNDPSAKSKFHFFRKKDFFVIENLEEADRTKNEEITFWKLESWAESEKKCDWWIGITKENSNMATYKACQNNGGKPINNARGYYAGFFDPCLPAEYVMSPVSIQECINSKGEIKAAKSGTDPNNMCGKAYKVAQEKKAQKEKEDNQKLAANLDSRINSCFV